jgi:hypothetical protein
LLNRFGLAILVIWSAMTKHVCKVVGKEFWKLNVAPVACCIYSTNAALPRPELCFGALGAAHV